MGRRPARRSRLGSSVALLVAAFAAAPAGGAEEAPPLSEAERAAARAPVERLHEALLDVMKRAGELGYEGRRDALAPVLRDAYDLPFMAEKALGPHWRRLDPEQRDRWIDTFRRLTTSTYADRFDGYSGEHFETLGVAPAGFGTRTVRTRLVPDDRDPVPLTYRVRPAGGGEGEGEGEDERRGGSEAQTWRIVDVYLDGTVSELAMRRSEYSSVVRREGFDALVEKLRERIAEAGEG